MKITKNPPQHGPGFHCCNCGSHQPKFDELQHKQVCVEIRIRQQWTTCRFCFPRDEISLRSTMHLNELAALCHTIADAKGWHDEPRDFGTVMMLIVTEIAEAMEAWREPDANITEIWYGLDKLGKPEGVPIELADALIRILHATALYGIDISEAVKTKMKYNMDRPHRHGNKNA